MGYYDSHRGTYYCSDDENNEIQFNKKWIYLWIIDWIKEELCLI